MAYHDLDVDAIASMYSYDPKSSYRTQFEHRVNIIKRWKIPAGSRVLEIGPGQGDCTIVLAAAVGEHGHVDAVDPAPLDYGTSSLHSAAQAPFHLTHTRFTHHAWRIPSPPLGFPNGPSDNMDPRLTL